MIVLDVGMPLLNGMEAATQIRTKARATKLVFLSQQSAKEYVQAASQLGACAYVLKSAGAAELVTAISEPQAAVSFCQRSLQRFGEPDQLAAGNFGPLFGCPLTPRQREVLQLVAEGKSAKEWRTSSTSL